MLTKVPRKLETLLKPLHKVTGMQLYFSRTARISISVYINHNL